MLSISFLIADDKSISDDLTHQHPDSTSVIQVQSITFYETDIFARFHLIELIRNLQHASILLHRHGVWHLHFLVQGLTE